MSLAALLDTAHRIARETARQQPQATSASGAESPATVVPLARALRGVQAHETTLADGTLKIVTAAGRSYCVKPKKSFQRSGLIDEMAIATNCP